MAEGTSTGGGCPEKLHIDEPVGRDWTEIVERLLNAGAERAREQLETQEQVGDGEVEVRIAMTAFIRFPHKGKEVSADDGGVACVCTNDGTWCVCLGAACDFPACCGAVVAMK